VGASWGNGAFGTLLLITTLFSARNNSASQVDRRPNNFAGYTFESFLVEAKSPPSVFPTGLFSFSRSGFSDSSLSLSSVGSPAVSSTLVSSESGDGISVIMFFVEAQIPRTSVKVQRVSTGKGHPSKEFKNAPMTSAAKTRVSKSYNFLSK
jgi:hypothetical protein